MIKSRGAILALLTGLNFLNYIDRYVLASVLKHITSDLQLSHLEAGLGGSAFMVGYFMTAPLFGARADKGNRKGLIAFGVLVWSLATVATGLSSGLVAFLIARMFVGIGEASYATLAPTIIDDMTPPESKNRTLAIFYLAIPLGSAMGFIMGGVIDTHIGWHEAFFIAGAPGALLALTCLLIVEPPRKLAAAKTNIVENLRVLAKIPLFRRAVVGYCAYTAALGAFAYWGPEFLGTRFEITTEKSGFWFGVTTVISGTIATLVGGRWADRTVRELPAVDPDAPHDARENRVAINALLRICALGMVVAAPLGVVTFFMPSLPTFLVLTFFVQLGLFVSTSPVNAIGLRSVPPYLRASAMAAMIFAIHLFGDLWSTAALGLLRDLLPMLLAMMALPLTFALSAYWWWPRKREAE